jgi:hypothetical protein
MKRSMMVMVNGLALLAFTALSCVAALAQMQDRFRLSRWIPVEDGREYPHKRRPPRSPAPPSDWRWARRARTWRSKPPTSL